MGVSMGVYICLCIYLTQRIVKMGFHICKPSHLILNPINPKLGLSSSCR